MKKFVLILLCTVFTALSLSSCEAVLYDKDAEPEFEISYSLDQKYYFTGDVIELTVTAKNTGGNKKYEDAVSLFQDATLRYSSKHIDFSVSSTPVAVTSHAEKSLFKILKEGDTIEILYRFATDENSPHGFYDIEFLFNRNTKSYSKAIKITEELSEEEAKVREITDKLLLEQYKDCPEIDNLSDFSIHVSTNENYYHTRYYLCIYGYQTQEDLEITLENNSETGDLEVSFINTTYLGVYSEHLYCFAEEEFLKAKEENPWGWLSVQDGYLCFGYEKIIDITPENPGESGCNIDHIHKVYYNRICQKPHNE